MKKAVQLSMIVRKKTRQLLCALFVLLYACSAHAFHIVGGVMSYECLGDGDFRITINMYRDCSPECLNNDNCAKQFDSGASIAVYNCGIFSDCTQLIQGQTVQNGSFGVNIIRETNVPPPDIMCVEVPDQCVLEGVYEFDLSDFGITLDTNSLDPYIISYQRCCRNTNINNLTQPSNNSGATFSVKISPDALKMCNSSPTFNAFPPTIICNDIPIRYDHSASDSDNDSLVYYFCAPFNGGGSFNPNPPECDGNTPSPSCPPNRFNGDYDAIRYQGSFSGSNPLPGIFSLDSETGLLQGVPDQIGRFVVGICVDEYRGDTLLSTFRRDFQFNIEECEPEVSSIISSDSINPFTLQEFVFTECGQFDVFFDNQSTPREDIIDWFWRFDIKGTDLTLIGDNATNTNWDVTVNFPDTGLYTGILVLNPGSDVCSDTADITVSINPRIESIFELEFDSCFAFPVQFTNESFSDGGPITRYLWDFGDGTTSNLEKPSYLYQTPGSYIISLEVADANRCVNQSSKPIEFFPAPLNVIVIPEPSDNCFPVSVFFNNLSRPVDSTYIIEWDFGDGTTSSEVSPTHIYEEAGDFTVGIRVTSTNGCTVAAQFIDFILVEESPEAAFSFTPTEPSTFAPTVQFSDLSQRAFSLRWEFDNLGTSSFRDPSFTFPEDSARNYTILQIATHMNGCIDTAIQEIFISVDFSYFLPNAFTPNGDGENDFYLGVGELNGVSNFVFSIYNRWGQKMFETTDRSLGWNGRIDNQGDLSQPGVYLCYVTFNDSEGIPREFKSFATLIQ